MNQNVKLFTLTTALAFGMTNDCWSLMCPLMSQHDILSGLVFIFYKIRKEILMVVSMFFLLHKFHS